MSTSSIPDLFERRFPTGSFGSCDFRPHFDGFGHNAYVAIEPLGGPQATLALAHALLAEMCDFLRPLAHLFGEHDRVQFVVGFPASVKPTRRQILKGWIPAAHLGDVKPPDFASVGGALAEVSGWDEGLWPSFPGE